MTSHEKKYVSAIGQAKNTAGYKSRKIAAELAIGAVKMGLSQAPIVGSALAKGVNIIKPLIVNAVAGDKPGSIKRGNSKYCAVEKLLEKLAYSSNQPDKEPEIVLQQKTLNNILSILLRQSEETEKPHIKSLKLELLSIPDLPGTEPKTTLINLNIEDFKDINELLMKIKDNKLFNKLNDIYDHITPPEIQSKLIEQDNIINQIFIVLNELVSRLTDKSNVEIKEFSSRDTINIGNLTMIYGSKTHKNRASRREQQNINFRRVMILQELLISKVNKMSVPFKQNINNVLFLSKQHVKLINKLINTQLNILTPVSESETKDEKESGVKKAAVAIKDLINDNKDEIIKAAKDKVIDNEAAREVLDVALGSETKVLRNYLRFLAKKPAHNISGLQNIEEGSKWNKYVTAKNMKAAFTTNEYYNYLGFLLFSTSNSSDHEQLQIAEKVLSEYMLDDSCNTELNITDSLGNIEIKQHQEIKKDVGIYNGKLILEFRNGYTITVQQIGKLTNILPNLISGLFTDLYRYMIYEMCNPDNEALYKLRKNLLNLYGYEADADLCQISLLSISNYLFPLYNLLYRSLINLYIPINFDGLLNTSSLNSEELLTQPASENMLFTKKKSSSNYKPMLVKNMFSSYNSGSNYTFEEPIMMYSPTKTVKKKTSNKLITKHSNVKDGDLSYEQGINKSKKTYSTKNKQTIKRQIIV